MTDKMSKEEARSVLNEFLSRNHLELVTNVKAYVLEIVDSIEPEHQKVVLPKAVGEQWDKLVVHYVSNQAVTDKWSAINYAIGSLPNLGSSSLVYGDLVRWWEKTQDSYTKLADAARYGWVPEKEKLWNIFVPKAIKVPGHVSIYAKFKRGVQPVNTDGLISAGEYTFTKEELIKYGLDGDLFEKVLVKDTK
ncbi:DUF1642 domain-containing protein [Schleiferilactobacillus harbinensis]|jgi:hypothetical protein|uniref:DUF1642 domain-containing protein n=2 Tax=Schleiferilactobacillus harbinensis TaxID=304207 RepID=UPI0026735582|nr:DUF1642 domain-containing protein [Schleiferilactobacillus harbinensis]